jgi:hypothetical protein
MDTVLNQQPVESQNGCRMDNTRDYGRPRWCLDVTATLLHGGLVSSRQVTNKREQVVCIISSGTSHNQRRYTPASALYISGKKRSGKTNCEFFFYAAGTTVPAPYQISILRGIYLSEKSPNRADMPQPRLLVKT